MTKGYYTVGNVIVNTLEEARLASAKTGLPYSVHYAPVVITTVSREDVLARQREKVMEFYRIKKN